MISAGTGWLPAGIKNVAARSSPSERKDPASHERVLVRYVYQRPSCQADAPARQWLRRRGIRVALSHPGTKLSTLPPPFRPDFPPELCCAFRPSPLVSSRANALNGLPGPTALSRKATF